MNKKIVFVGFLALGFAFTPLKTQTWSSLKRLTWNPEPSRDVNIATNSGNTIHLVWEDASTESHIFEIFYKRSTDRGTTWAATRRLTWTNSQSFNPVIAADSANNIHLIWEQNCSMNFEIYYKKSSNNGLSWSGNKRLTWNSGGSFTPSIGVDSSNHIYVVWSQGLPGNFEIYFKRSTNGGNSWVTKRLTWNTGTSGNPRIVIDSNDYIHVVWNDDSPGNHELFYKKSINGGSTWTSAKRLTWTSKTSWNPDITADSTGVLHVVWQDDVSGEKAIYYKKSTNNGSTWVGTKRLTWGTDGSDQPVVASDSVNNVHVLWRKEISGKWYIFYKRVNSSGIWGVTTRLTWYSNRITYPDIAVDFSDTVHAVWEDDSPGNWEIFYKHELGNIL